MESDAATAGSSVSESRERSLVLHPLRVPSPSARAMVGNRSAPLRVPSPPAPAAAVFPAAASAFAASPAPAPNQPLVQPVVGEDLDGAASLTDRAAMPPPSPSQPTPG